MDNIYPLDIWHTIFHHCDLLSQLGLFSACSEFYHSFFITDISHIQGIYRYKLTNSVLKQKKFSRIIRLYLASTNISDISFLTNLKKLRINNMISQQNIQALNLIELDIDYTVQIKDISFMTNLKKLYARGICGVDQQSIRGLDLIEFDASLNEKIKDVSFMTNLKELSITNNCGVDQRGIKGLNLIEFDASLNEKIKDVSF